MSLLAKTTFALCCTTSIAIIAYVHIKQEYDREQLHLGVQRDIERQERRKIENLYILEKQKSLADELKKAEQEARARNN